MSTMQGEIDSSGEYVWNTVGHDLRATVSLTSAAVNRNIEISINEGQDWFVPQFDCDEAGCIGFVLDGPISGIRFTGDEGDTWMVLR